MKQGAIKRAGYNPVKATGLLSLTKEEREKLTRVNQTDLNISVCLNCKESKCLGSRLCYVKHGGK